MSIGNRYSRLIANYANLKVPRTELRQNVFIGLVPAVDESQDGVNDAKANPGRDQECEKVCPRFPPLSLCSFFPFILLSMSLSIFAIGNLCSLLCCFVNTALSHSMAPTYTHKQTPVTVVCLHLLASLSNV